MYIKNNQRGSLLRGNCEKDGNALYEGETSDYLAQLKICGGVKCCESLVPGKSGVDFCED